MGFLSRLFVPALFAHAVLLSCEADAATPDCEPPRIRDVPAQWSFPVALGHDSANNIYVLGYRSNVKKFSPNGSLLASSGVVSWASGLAVTPEGKMYVVSEGRHVTALGTNGEYEFQWGEIGTSPGEFIYPFGIAVASNGDVYVSEINYPRVLRFTATGEFLNEWGSDGSGPGQFGPGGASAIACSPNGEVLVVDGSNCRVERFGQDGSYLGEWNVRPTPDVNCEIYAIATDDQGNAYLTDYWPHMVRVFSPSGEPLCEWDGSRDRTFLGPGGTTVDHLGNIWVADLSGAQEFGYVPVPTKPTTWGRLKSTYR